MTVTASPPTSPPERAAVKHPAKYSAGLVELFAHLLAGYRKVLDPFAGTGRIHQLRDLGNFETVGVEIEQEWADLTQHTQQGNALDLTFKDNTFDAVCTSPCYGNRMADHHNARDGSTRHTYRHTLGRPLSADSSGQLQWGPQYRAFHEQAWSEATRVLRPGGRFVLNLKDHWRQGQLQPVTGWHTQHLLSLGYELLHTLGHAAPGMRAGANGNTRAGNAEAVLVFRQPER